MDLTLGMTRVTSSLERYGFLAPGSIEGSTIFTLLTYDLISCRFPKRDCAYSQFYCVRSMYRKHPVYPWYDHNVHPSHQHDKCTYSQSNLEETSQTTVNIKVFCKQLSIHSLLPPSSLFAFRRQSKMIPSHFLTLSRSLSSKLSTRPGNVAPA